LTWSSIHCVQLIRAIADIYTLLLHDALPISLTDPAAARFRKRSRGGKKQVIFLVAEGGLGKDGRGASGERQAESSSSSAGAETRSEEHTSELQSRENLVCRLRLEVRNRRITE